MSGNSNEIKIIPFQTPLQAGKNNCYKRILAKKDIFETTSVTSSETTSATSATTTTTTHVTSSIIGRQHLSSSSF
jgi:hypothetical protein